jgi:hypothetical protein
MQQRGSNGRAGMDCVLLVGRCVLRTNLAAASGSPRRGSCTCDVRRRVGGQVIVPTPGLTAYAVLPTRCCLRAAAYALPPTRCSCLHVSTEARQCEHAGASVAVRAFGVVVRAFRVAVRECAGALMRACVDDGACMRWCAGAGECMRWWVHALVGACAGGCMRW